MGKNDLPRHSRSTNSIATSRPVAIATFSSFGRSGRVAIYFLDTLALYSSATRVLSYDANSCLCGAPALNVHDKCYFFCTLRSRVSKPALTKKRAQEVFSPGPFVCRVELRTLGHRLFSSQRFDRQTWRAAQRRSQSSRPLHLSPTCLRSSASWPFLIVLKLRSCRSYLTIALTSHVVGRKQPDKAIGNSGCTVDMKRRSLKRSFST